MEKVRINAGSGYYILIGSGLTAESGKLLLSACGKCRAAVITDSNVEKLYLPKVLESLKSAGFESCSFVFPAGESSKNLDTFGDILNFLADNSMGRDDIVIALGGGVTGDLAGFAAGCYMRGVRFVQMPTTLLAAVDSSVGGKTAVDLPNGKNLAGLFYQPELVICDTQCFDTLPENEVKNGIAEAIKTAVLSGGELFKLLESGTGKGNIERIISLCVRYKAGVVERDEYEIGERKLLNLGHTIGHAIERCSGFKVPHGSAVAIGLAAMTRYAEVSGVCSAETAHRILRVMERHGMQLKTDIPANELAAAACSDKKRTGDSITLVVPENIGKCRLIPTPMSELEGIIRRGTEAL